MRIRILLCPDRSVWILIKLKTNSSHFRKCCEDNFHLCVRLMQNRMEIFPTAAKLLVWRLRPRVQKVQSPHYWQMGGKNLKSINHYKYLGAVLNILSSQMTKTFGDNCDKNTVQQTSCEPLFSDVQSSQKCTFSFLLYPHVCITNMVEFQKVMHAKIACGL